MQSPPGIEDAMNANETQLDWVHRKQTVSKRADLHSGQKTFKAYS